MPLVPQIFNMASESERPAEAYDEDWKGLESLSQRLSAITGHSEEAAHHSSYAAAAWRCAACDSPDLHRISSGDWVCSGCGSRDYYRVGEQTWRRTRHGTWMYFPEGQEPLPPWTRAAETAASPAPTGPPPSAPPSQETAQSTTGAARRRRRRRRGGKPDPGDGDWDEQAESETLTHDSLVTVSTRHADPRPDPRLPVPGAAAPAQPPLLEGFPGVRGGLDPELPAEHPAYLDQSHAADGRKKGASSTTPSWNSRMGPERGVKWRGGAPPAPPKWAYDKEDLRAFAKYERKVRLWEIQVEPYMSKREAALQLYNALSGEPEQELEHAPLERINSPQGINYILEQLRGPMSQRLVYQKRRFPSRIVIEELNAISRPWTSM